MDSRFQDDKMRGVLFFALRRIPAYQLLYSGSVDLYDNSDPADTVPEARSPTMTEASLVCRYFRAEPPLKLRINVKLS